MSRRSRVTAALALACCLALTACGPATGEGRGSSATAPSAAELYNRGRAAGGRGDHVRAEQYIKLAVARGYPVRRALVALIDNCLAASRLRAALTHVEHFLARDSDSWRLWLLAAVLDEALDQPVRAVERLKRALALEPGAALAHYRLGVLLLGDESAAHATARGHLGRYLELAPRGRHAAEVQALLAGQRAPHGRAARVR